MVQGPYGVQRADPTDVMGRRVGAYAIDLLITVLIVIAVGLPVFFAQVDRVATNRSDYCKAYNDQHASAFCIVSGNTAYTMTSSKVGKLSQSFYGAYLGWILLNAALLQGITGGTVGKLLLGLRVVRSDGQRAGIGRCLLRSILLVVIDSLCFIIGLVLAFTTSGHRRLGDMVASTLVVSKEYENRPLDVPGTVAPWMPAETYQPPPTSGDGPTWDPARNAYIQFDRSRSAWVQWDDKDQEWKTLDGS